MIIGTAGHVDHGKTTLVRALTGVDTDRLPEEKARGISIALGYAYCPLPDGTSLGYVDVPGHERFLPTMVSGATGIDFALLVVAADDGVMPQTREHLDIMRLLGVHRGAVALTKIDAVDGARRAAVRGEIAALAAGTALHDMPVFDVCAPTGAGLAPLREHLERAAMAAARPTRGGHFRLAVDRSFTLGGIGTVVTGTVHSGQLAVGDAVVVAPAGLASRVRSIHAQDRPSSVAAAGQRCALNLAGLARDAVGRGDWIVAPAAQIATTRIDARCTLLPGAGRLLRSGSAVHVHLGAAHVLGRIAFIDAEPAATVGAVPREPDAGNLVQLILQQAIGAWQGDRFIVRDAAGARTLAGGRVLDPFAPARNRRTGERRAVLAALEAGEPATQLARLLAHAPGGLDLRRFALASNVLDVHGLLAEREVRRIRTGGEDHAVAQAQWQALLDAAQRSLQGFHRDQPDEPGVDRTRLKRMAFGGLSPVLYAALLDDALASGRVRAAGPWLHLPGHRVAPSGEEQALLQRVLSRLAPGDFDPPWVRDLAAQAGTGESLVRAALLRAAQRGEVYQVVRDLFYHPQAIDELALRARQLQAKEGEVRAAAFRDITGLGRKRAIQVLEFFDRIGFLRRIQDRHLVRADTALDPGAIAGLGRSITRVQGSAPGSHG